MARFIVVDPSLCDDRGHHYNLTRKISLAAKKNGYQPVWLASDKISDAMAENHPEAFPTFGQGMYDAYKGAPTQSSKMSFVRRLGWKRDNLPTVIPKPVVTTDTLFDSLCEGLKFAFQEHVFLPHDIILFHTADGSTYRALAKFLSETPHETLPFMHVCTPYDPVGVMPNRKDAAEVMHAVHAIQDLGLLEKKVFLYGENDLLAEHLQEIWGSPVNSLPLPAAVFTKEEASSAQQFRQSKLNISDDTFLIISLGAARLEKGFNLFSDIIRRTFEFAGTEKFPNLDSKKIHFALHASPQIIGIHPVIQKSLDKLETFPNEQVTLFKHSLSDNSYTDLLLSSDAIAVPYNVDDYRVRGSGVVTEAIAAEKFLIASEGSYPGAMAIQYGGAIGSTPKELAIGLLNIIENRKHYAQILQKQSSTYKVSGTAEGYFRQLLVAQENA